MSSPPKSLPWTLKSEIRMALINNKVNACPMAMRVAWHSSGTYNKHTGKGGSNGGTMRFASEANDPANAGLSIIRDMLHPVQANNPGVSSADLWTAAGAAAVEFLGGPTIKHEYGRVDYPNESYCPPNGLIPDASQGAEHLREMFYRMGFGDEEIVALSGGHTLGRCHLTRSGYDGAWTTTPLNFNNEYYQNLMNLEWKEKVWDGPVQYETPSDPTLMMLPTDIALRTDPNFSKYARQFADDKDAFFDVFSKAYAKLLDLGVPKKREVYKAASEKAKTEAGKHFREHSMHGSIEHVTKHREEGADVDEADDTGRTAMHKAAFWGHIHVIKYLIEDCHCNLNVVDFNNDTPLHDAARFAHESVVRALIAAGADLTLQNNSGKTPLEVALEYSTTSTANKHDIVIEMLRDAERRGKAPVKGGGCPFGHGQSRL
jgi:hypothetical protein